MTDEEAKALGATHFRINGFGNKRYYAFKHGGWWLLCIDDEWYPDYEINPKDKLELIDEVGMNIEEIRKNALAFDATVEYTEGALVPQ